MSFRPSASFRELVLTKRRAMYCRQKALGWSSRNPLSPAVIELEIKRLLNLKAAYEGYLEASVPPPSYLYIYTHY